jgi:succinyl-CoA synthetase beta subunit
MPILSEAESKALLAAHGVPVPSEALVSTPGAAARAAAAIGFPVVAKLCGANIAHKTERGLVHLNLADAAAVEAAAAALLAAATPADGEVGVLVGPMVRGWRELIAGLVRDPQFGPAVMLGIGGVMAEALADVAFRLVPLTRADAEEMVDELAHQALLGPLRGDPAVDREALANVVTGLAALAASDPRIVSVDLNPLIVSAGAVVAVDALVEMAAGTAEEVAP